MKLGMTGQSILVFQSGIGRPYFCAKSPSIMVKWKVPFTVFSEYLQKYMVFYCLFVLQYVLKTYNIKSCFTPSTRTAEMHIKR